MSINSPSVTIVTNSYFVMHDLPMATAFLLDLTADVILWSPHYREPFPTLPLGRGGGLSVD